MAWQLRAKPEIERTGFGMDTSPCGDPHCEHFGMYVEAVLWHDEPVHWWLGVNWYEN